jgi:membrane protein DedA with SNARE-associated domain
MIHFCSNSLVLMLGIVLAGFLSEDGATITAATLTAASALDSRLAFLSAFVGLWVGDLGVFALARTLGPEIARRRWFRRWLGSPKVPTDGSLRRHGFGLAFSRFVPGTRLAAYIAAGFARMSVRQFAVITAASAVVWTVLAFALIHIAPMHSASALMWLGIAGSVGVAIKIFVKLWRVFGRHVARRVCLALGRLSWREFSAAFFRLSIDTSGNSESVRQ